MFHKITNNVVLILLFLSAPFIFVQCGERAEHAETTFEDEREQLITNLENLRDDLDESIDELNSRMEDNGEEELISMRDNLRDDRSDVERAINDLEDTTEETWESVRMQSENLYDRVTTTLNQQNERLQDRFNE